MDHAEIKYQAARISAYQQLAVECLNLDAALSALETPFGVHRQSAFTGNTRESRRIVEIRFGFSATLGGEAPVDLTVQQLNVPAWKLGVTLRELLLERRRVVHEEMKKL